jgi:hypothetical protein
VGLMTITKKPAGQGSNTVQRADRWALIGAILCSTFILGPIGLVPLGVGIALLVRARRAGELTRPLAVTLLGILTLIEAVTYLEFFALDVFANGTHIGRLLITGYGRLADGFYYVGHNSTALGGVADPYEKMWTLLFVFVIGPMGTVAGWGFLKLRRWGFHFMVVAWWLKLIVWLGYLLAMMLDYTIREGAGAYGVVGWWVINAPYTIAPFFVIPWLYMLDQRKWTSRSAS